MELSAPHNKTLQQEVASLEVVPSQEERSELRGEKESLVSSQQEKKFALEKDEGRSAWLLCALCGHGITRNQERIEVNGSHQHTFANPHGFFYRIGCFREAPGCAGWGHPSSQFPWFAGYLWQIEICRRCRSHLGWLFHSDEEQFHGLVLDHLVEEEPKPEA